MDVPLRTLDFATAVRRHSWDWLLGLRRRLKVDLQIVDMHGASLLPQRGGSLSAALARADVAAALSRALQSRQHETVQLANGQILCAALTSGPTVGGALVLARTDADAERAGDSTRELDVIASWLRGSIEAHLSSAPPVESDEFRKLAALRKTLSDAEGRNGAHSDHSLLQVFAQALAIWEDVDLYAYVEEIGGGRFVRQTTPPGAVRAMPQEVPAGIVPPSTEPMRLPASVIEELGAATPDDVLAVVLGGDGEYAARLLLFSGPISAPLEGRLAVYVGFLDQALRHATTTTLLRLHRALWRRLTAQEGEPEAVAGAALDDVRAVLGAESVALAATLGSGVQLLEAGEKRAFTVADDAPAHRQLTTLRRLQRGTTLTLAATASEGRPFTSADQQLLEGAAETFGPWVDALLQRTQSAQERRATPARSFEDMMNQVASRAVRDGTSVAVVVIRLENAAFHPGLTHAVAAQVKSRLRAPEPAGALAEGEIGALLYDANAAQAQAAVDRLRRAMESVEEGKALAGAAIGIAYRAGGSDYDDSLIPDARYRAMRRLDPGKTGTASR